MDKRKQQIEKNIVNYCKVSNEIDYHTEILDKLEHQFATIISELYQDRPKKYIKDVLALVKEKQRRKELDEDCLFYLISEVKEWLKDYDLFIDERIERSEGKELAMLKGEIE